MSTDDQPTFRLTLRARPDRVPPAKRVAQLLKHALRCLGLVCVEAIQVRPDGNEPVGPPPFPPTVAQDVAGDAELSVGAEPDPGPSGGH